MILIIFIIIIVFTINKAVQNRIKAKRYGYKVFQKDYKTFVYSEKIKGIWEEIQITRAYEAGSFYVEFKNKKDWKDYPNWAQDRDKIVKRVTVAFPEQKKKSEIDDIGSHLKS
jgi:hypothetical protein